MTARANQGAIQVALSGDGPPRVNQGAVLVAVSFASPARANQGAVLIAARRYPIRNYAPIDSAMPVAYNAGQCIAVPMFTRETA